MFAKFSIDKRTFQVSEEPLVKLINSDDGGKEEEEDEDGSQSLLPPKEDDTDWQCLLFDDDDDDQPDGREKEDQDEASTQDMFEAGLREKEEKGEPSPAAAKATAEASKIMDAQRRARSLPPPRAQLIDPLPQPNRRSFNRGISANTAIAMQERDEIEREIGYKMPPPFHTTKKFYRSKSVPEPEAPIRLTKDELKEQRTKALKELAEKERPATENKKTSAAPATKVKQSVPKVQRLTECDLFKPSRKGIPSPSVGAAKRALKELSARSAYTGQMKLLQKPSEKKEDGAVVDKVEEECPQREEKKKGHVADTREDEDSGRTEEDPAMGEKKKSPRTIAETKLDGDGNKRIAKLKFNNVISNVFSQDPSGGGATLPAAPAAVLTASPSMSTSPSTSSAAGTKPKKERRSIRWRDQVHPGAPLVDVREIEPEGAGRRVQDQKQFDTALMRNSNPNNLVPGGMQRPPTPQNKSTLDFFTVLLQILKWQTAWLVEQKNQKEAPPVQGDRLKCSHVTPMFSSYRDYCATFYPLMLHELWETVYRDYLNPGYGGVPEIIVCVTNIVNSDHVSTIQVLGFITDHEKRRSVLSEGWLCNLQLRYTMGKGQKDQIKPCFGLIESCRVRWRSSESDVIYAKKLEDASVPEKRKHLRHAVEIHITIKKLNASAGGGQLNVGKPLIVRGVSMIKSSLRLFQAVDNAQKMPLFNCILKPRPEKFYLGNATDDFMPAVRDLLPNLNEMQSSVVRNVARLCTTNLAEPQLALIQGPPGTGKTTTITGIIMQLVFRWKHFYAGASHAPRILVTAPSNAAVDEIARRLLVLNSHLSEGNALKMIRVGREHVIHPDVRWIQAEKLRDREVEARVYRESNRASVELEVRSRQATLNQLGADLVKFLEAKDDAQADLVTRRIKEETSLLQRAKNSITVVSEKQRAGMREAAMRDVFRHAQIVFATLNSSLNGQMEKCAPAMAMNSISNRPFEVAIVDEASQSVEPEMLIPMSLGFTKLVMVGDPEQLPATVLSQKAKNLSYNFSMFGRLFKLFDSQPPPASNPAQMLNIQYRMHPEIAQWPNTYFYGGKLKNGPQDRTSPFLLPYAMLDSRKLGRENKKGSALWNEGEAKFIGQLVKAILFESVARNERLTIGVITFYARQKEKLEAEMRMLGIEEDVLVRTVDAFQGSECDVIIISCVRTGGGGIGHVADSERLNVALTRAKVAMYIVGKFDALQQVIKT